jgi:hypothetical protein
MQRHRYRFGPDHPGAVPNKLSPLMAGWETGTDELSVYVTYSTGGWL